MIEPPAPRPDDVVHYRQSVEIISEIFEERFPIGERPDIGAASNAERLRHDLNRGAVSVARLAYEIGHDSRDLEVDPESIESLREELTAMEELTDGIEDTFRVVD